MKLKITYAPESDNLNIGYCKPASNGVCFKDKPGLKTEIIMANKTISNNVGSAQYNRFKLSSGYANQDLPSVNKNRAGNTPPIIADSNCKRSKERTITVMTKADSMNVIPNGLMSSI